MSIIPQNKKEKIYVREIQSQKKQSRPKDELGRRAILHRLTHLKYWPLQTSARENEKTTMNVVSLPGIHCPPLPQASASTFCSVQAPPTITGKLPLNPAYRSEQSHPLSWGQVTPTRLNETKQFLENFTKFLTIFSPRNNSFPLLINEEVLAPVSPGSHFMIRKQSATE